MKVKVKKLSPLLLLSLLSPLLLLMMSPFAHADYAMPPQASSFAASVDALYGFLLYASLISCILVIGGLTYFAIKYRRKTASDKTAYIAHNAVLEFLWSFIPFVIFMVVFVWGWVVYNQMRSMPKDALEVHVVGQKWNWNFLYKSGRKSGGELVVPVNTPVKLIMNSKDVLHSLYIPAFRVKQDVIPGRYTALWFEATKMGTFHIFCAEYCGDQHSSMLAKVKVVSLSHYENWLANDPYKGLTLVEVGKKIFQTNCTACHMTTQNKLIGPGLGDVFGRTQNFEDGSSLRIDENYLRESILRPESKVVKGYKGVVMTSFQGQLNEDELKGVIEYLKSLK